MNNERDDEKNRDNEDPFFGDIFKDESFINVMKEIEKIMSNAKYGMDGNAPTAFGFKISADEFGPSIQPFQVKMPSTTPTEIELTIPDRQELLHEFNENVEELSLIIELPGIHEEELHVEAGARFISITTTGSRTCSLNYDLPCTIDPNHISARYHNGILELVMKKK